LTIAGGVCNEANVLVDTPSTSVVAEVTDDFDSLDVDGITQDDDAIDTESDEVCDADSGGGYWDVIVEVSNEDILLIDR